MDKKLLPIGTRVRFIKTSGEGSNEFSPGCIYFREGDEGVVTGHGCKEGHWVKWDKWPVSFGAELGIDFVEIENK